MSQRHPPTFRVVGSNGWVRYITSTHPSLAMRFVGFAMMTAEATVRPGFREMIDTIKWKDVR